MHSDTLAIDFGTSNSAVAILDGEDIRRIPIEADADTLPTAVFFPTGRDRADIGVAATSALVSGQDGRYMRALKSVLGQPLLHDARLIGGRRRTLADIITEFLAEVKARAEAETKTVFKRVLSGRPVHFYTKEAGRDVQAADDLAACYRAAGFEDVAFLVEPEAAAIASYGAATKSELGLIVDIGGGTSDFSIFANEGARPMILANHGIRLGGTDFDHVLSLAHAMPLLGHGGEMRREMGAGLLAVPRAPFVDLATWAKIPFLYTGEMRREAADMARLAVEPEKLNRFFSVLENELGHDIALSVEDGKIQANSEAGHGAIGLDFVESGLSAPISSQNLYDALASHRQNLRDAAVETMNMAGVGAADIGRVIFVGGSSLMQVVSDEMRDLCPDAEFSYSEAFTAVVDGLALATGYEAL